MAAPPSHSTNWNLLILIVQLSTVSRNREKEQIGGCASTSSMLRIAPWPSLYGTFRDRSSQSSSTAVRDTNGDGGCAHGCMTCDTFAIAACSPFSMKKVAHRNNNGGPLLLNVANNRVDAHHRCHVSHTRHVHEQQSPMRQTNGAHSRAYRLGLPSVAKFGHCFQWTSIGTWRRKTPSIHSALHLGSVPVLVLLPRCKPQPWSASPATPW